ncbi:MAG: glycosyltransferase family 2 protein [Candidatus Zixiibacteriota bacterium]
MPKLIVAIVSWNTRDLTRNCLSSLQREVAGLEHETWVVDNHSSDDSVQMIRGEFPPVVLIENTKNVGFARANNQILREARGDYYLLLNSDTIVPPGSIRTLCRFMDEHPEAAAVGPRLHNGQGSVEPPLKPLPSLSGEWRYCLAYHSGPLAAISRRLMRNRLVDWHSIKGPTESEVLSAACLLIRRTVIDQIGLLAEDYFLFSEENDYFTRMKAAGLRGYYLPDVEIVHLLGMSRKKRASYDSEVNFFRSRLLYFRKFYPGRARIVRLIYYLFFGWSSVWSRLSGLFKSEHESDQVALYSRLLDVLKAG